MRTYLTRVVLLLCVSASGCQTASHTDQGAVVGGLAGAGVGAILGDALDQEVAGTAIGAGVGALTGAAMGNQLDQVEARNRAAIEASLGQQVRAGAVTIDNVVQMTQAGVAPRLIVNHIQYNGVAKVPDANDLIFLQQNGVSEEVIAAMQQPPQRPAKVVSQPVGPPPVIVEEYHYGPPPCFYGPPHWRFHHHRHYRRPCHRPGVSLGFSFD